MLQTQLVNCPACHHPTNRVLAKVFSSPVRMMTDLVRCRSCKLAYLNPRPSHSQEKTFYEKEYFERADFKEWKDNRVHFFEYALDKLEKKTDQRNLLDVGCGGGFFLDMARQRGWNVKGLELSEAAVKYAQESLHLPVFQKEIRDCGFASDEFSVITLWNVLDQMWDPDLQIKELHRIMKPGGLLALRVTNLSFHLALHRFFESLKSIHLIRRDLREPTVFHLMMFNVVSLKRFLESAGFADIKVDNSPLDTAPQVLVTWLGERASKAVTSSCYGVTQLIQWVTGIPMGPSLYVIAKKK